VEYLWRWFGQLNQKREAGMGIGPITYTSIKAWAELYGVDIGPWEVSIIDALDSHFRSINDEKNDPDKGGQSIQDAAQDKMDLDAARVAQRKRREVRKNG
jgi:hypothetical protein